MKSNFLTVQTLMRMNQKKVCMYVCMYACVYVCVRIILRMCNAHITYTHTQHQHIPLHTFAYRVEETELQKAARKKAGPKKFGTWDGVFVCDLPSICVICVSLYAYVCVCIVYVNAVNCLCVCKCMYVRGCICVYVYVYVMCICVYVFAIGCVRCIH